MGSRAVSNGCLINDAFRVAAGVGLSGVEWALEAGLDVEVLADADGFQPLWEVCHVEEAMGWSDTHAVS